MIIIFEGATSVKERKWRETKIKVALADEWLAKNETDKSGGTRSHTAAGEFRT
jgi:hypothetical protein